MRRASKFIGIVVMALMTFKALADDSCKPVYLTIDTGHMGVADQIAEVLSRQHVKVTFFAANERTKVGDGTLGTYWAAWWKARAQEGHEFASHTWDHEYWRADLPDGKFRMRPSSTLGGKDINKDEVLTTAQYCAELKASSDRLREMTGKEPLPLFRAPGGKTSPALLTAAKDQCGYAHVAWADAGFLGDELPSDTYPNRALLAKALRDIRAGDILMMHLGIWSRKDPWAPANLEPLIVGLKERGFCFKTLREHPDYAQWITQHP